MSQLKKKIIAIFCLISLAFLSQPQTLHIYHDKATTPSLLQMINFIEQADSNLKIISWERFHNHIQKKEEFKNTLFTTDEEIIL